MDTHFNTLGRTILDYWKDQLEHFSTGKLVSNYTLLFYLFLHEFVYVCAKSIEFLTTFYYNGKFYIHMNMLDITIWTLCPNLHNVQHQKNLPVLPAGGGKNKLV